jgi:dTDP-4-dehydrorhamnose 3,5-epimerase
MEGAMPELVDAGIAGAYVVPLTPHPDSRGSFTEVYRREWIPGGAEMVQSNLSLSHAGVLRGLHIHRRQADYWCIFTGRAFVGLFDLRRGSPTEGKKAEIWMDADEGRSGLYIPKGVAHGFYAQTEIELQYLVDQYYSGADEFGVAWDDPDVGIDWPSREPITSDRDKANPSLSEVLQDPPPYEA